MITYFLFIFYVMKKYLFLAAVLFTAVCGSFNYNQGKEGELSDLAKANIKALSKDGADSWPCIVNFHEEL